MTKNGDGLYGIDNGKSGHDRYIYPDNLTFDKEPFATVIPNRSGSAFKVHKNEGLANGALSHHREGAKYRQEDGVWVKVWQFYEPVDCEKCGSKLDPDRDKSIRWLRSPLHKGPAIFAPLPLRFVL